MRTDTISQERFDAIERAVDSGSWTVTDVTLLTDDLQPAELAKGAAYLVVANAYAVTIMQLDIYGCPIAVLDAE